ncbi:MAG TPA: class I adenylate-forming enzyme family protein, partial [Acidimicrobiia bacterium]|nr:class I adenylate-forming enzyme family protein [Acidimicrobiia bacterium]
RDELDARATAVAATLRDAGAEPGTPVVVMLRGPEAIAALFGVWRAGLVAVPVNPRLTDAEVTRLLERVPVAAAVTRGSDAARFRGPVVTVEPDAVRLARDARPPAPPARYGPDAALVQMTSGTTGPPTPVVLQHGAVLAQLDRVLGTLRGGRTEAPRDRPPMPNLIPVSLSLWAGIYNVCFAFRAGAPVVLLDPFETATFAALVSRYGIRSVVLPPAAMAMLADDPAVTSLAPLRLVRSITAPLSPFLARRFHDRFGVDILNSYGQTELGGEVVGWTAADVRAFGETKLGAVGRPHPGVDVRVVDDELQVRTGAAVGGDTGGGALDDRLDADGWFRTGDLARIDDDGFVWIEGRVAEMINRGGLKVYPREVEEVLRARPEVRDVAVVGAPDERLGEVPVAFVVTDALDASALEAHCREALAPYKVPVRFVAVDALPRSEVGKVLTRDLVARLTP